jgi:hypothetical protein
VLIAVMRRYEDGAILEELRTLRPRGGEDHARAFEFLEVTGEDHAPGEHLDLAWLEKGAYR